MSDQVPPFRVLCRGLVGYRASSQIRSPPKCCLNPAPLLPSAGALGPSPRPSPSLPLDIEELYQAAPQWRISPHLPPIRERGAEGRRQGADGSLCLVLPKPGAATAQSPKQRRRLIPSRDKAAHAPTRERPPPLSSPRRPFATSPRVPSTSPAPAPPRSSPQTTSRASTSQARTRGHRDARTRARANQDARAHIHTRT